MCHYTVWTTLYYVRPIQGFHASSTEGHRWTRGCASIVLGDTMSAPEWTYMSGYSGLQNALSQVSHYVAHSAAGNSNVFSSLSFYDCSVGVVIIELKIWCNRWGINSNPTHSTLLATALACVRSSVLLIKLLNSLSYSSIWAHIYHWKSHKAAQHTTSALKRFNHWHWCKERRLKTKGVVTLHSNHSKYTATIQPHVFKMLIIILLFKALQQTWIHIKKLKLTDPKFLTPYPIDVIIGADSTGKSSSSTSSNNLLRCQLLNFEYSVGWFLVRFAYHCHIYTLFIMPKFINIIPIFKNYWQSSGSKKNCQLIQQRSSHLKNKNVRIITRLLILVTQRNDTSYASRSSCQLVS